MKLTLLQALVLLSKNRDVVRKAWQLCDSLDEDWVMSDECPEAICGVLQDLGQDVQDLDTLLNAIGTDTEIGSAGHGLTMIMRQIASGDASFQSGLEDTITKMVDSMKNGWVPENDPGTVRHWSFPEAPRIPDPSKPVTRTVEGHDIYQAFAETIRGASPQAVEAAVIKSVFEASLEPMEPGGGVLKGDEWVVKPKVEWEQRDVLPRGHLIIEQADRMDGRVSQTVQTDKGEEYERIVHAEEAYGPQEPDDVDPGHDRPHDPSEEPLKGMEHYDPDKHGIPDHPAKGNYGDLGVPGDNHYDPSKRGFNPK